MRLLVLDSSILQDTCLYDGCLSTLSQARRQKIERYKQDGDKRLSVAAGVLLDIALADFGLREASAPFQYNPFKKPFLADGPCFSISHSGSYAVCACGEHELGVDIEQPRMVKDALLRRVCTSQEAARLLAMDASTRNREFVRLWAVKESVLKWLGTGISVDPRQISVRLDAPGGETAVVEQGITEVHLAVREYALEGYGFALCCERGTCFPQPEFVGASQLRRML